MTEERRREIIAFQETFAGLPDTEYFASLEEEGITIEDMRAAEEEPEE